MRSQTVEREVAFSREQLFDLVADVERYPEFVPWWVAARVRKREGDSVYYTDQVVRMSMVSQRFTTRTDMHRPSTIDVTSSEKPFKRLEIRWKFDPLGPERCRVRLTVLFHFSSAALAKMMTLASNEAVHRLMQAFEERAEQVYAPRGLGLDGISGLSARDVASPHLVTA
jgi:coenzyme Q-binding protein COQ10